MATLWRTMPLLRLAQCYSGSSNHLEMHGSETCKHEDPYEGMHCSLPQMAQQCMVSWFLSCHTAENRALGMARVVLRSCCAVAASELLLLL